MPNEYDNPPSTDTVLKFFIISLTELFELLRYETKEFLFTLPNELKIFDLPTSNISEKVFFRCFFIVVSATIGIMDLLFCPNR